MAGRFQVYTGNGKGKSTAAMGLALRAAGAGLAVYFAQFQKNGEDGGIALLKTFPKVETAAFGDGSFVLGKPSAKQCGDASHGLRLLREIVSSPRFGLVVADEICTACSLGLLTEAELLALADARCASTELVFTGRSAPEAVLTRADLVTEMVSRKHYYDTEQLPARRGIEY